MTKKENFSNSFLFQALYPIPEMTSAGIQLNYVINSGVEEYYSGRALNLRYSHLFFTNLSLSKVIKRT